MNSHAQRGRLQVDAAGGTVSGRYALPAAGGLKAESMPTVIAVHGACHTSEYFDLTPSTSLLSVGSTLGFPVIAVDRPAYGSTTTLQTDDLGDVAGWLAAVVPAVCGDLGLGTSPVVVIGHSSGAAIALELAALEHGSFRMAGVSIVGLGPHAAEFVSKFEASLPAEGKVDPPPEEAVRNVMYAAPTTYDDAVPPLAAKAMVPGPVRELREVNHYPPRLREVLRSLTLPVQCVMPEFDGIWPYSPDHLEELAANLVAAPRVDAAMLPAAGHAADHHFTGRALHLRQLAFAVEAATIYEEE